MFSDPLARRFYPDMIDVEAARRWIEHWTRHREEHGVSLWALEDRKDGAFVGDCGLVWQDVAGERLLEVGYHVTAARRGVGLATEAAAVCLAHGFATLPVERIVSLVHVENAASRAVAERVHTGLWKEIDRRSMPHRVYATTREEFERRVAGG